MFSCLGGANMIYKKIENSYIGMLREEEDKTWLFYPRSFSKPHFMNKLVHEIWGLINNTSAEEIAHVLEKRYPNVDKQRILNDVKNTLSYFINLEMIKEEEMEKKQMEIALFEEADFSRASEFIIREIKCNLDNSFLFYPEQYKGEKTHGYYRAINMRTNHFHEIEVFLKVTDKYTDELQGVLGIYICPNNCVVYITTAIFNDKECLKEAINKLEIMLLNQNVKEIKVKFSDMDSEFKNEWEKINFSKESIIFKEAQDGCDYVIYGKEILN